MNLPHRETAPSPSGTAGDDAPAARPPSRVDRWTSPVHACLLVALAGAGIAAWGWSASSEWGARARAAQMLGPWGVAIGGSLAVTVAGFRRWMRRARPQWRRSAANTWAATRWALALLVVSGVATEILLRRERPIRQPPWLKHSLVLTAPHSAFQFDAELGWAGKPSIRGTFRRSVSPIKWIHNSEGFLDVEQDHLGDSRPVILVLGDSFARATDVTLDDSFAGQLRSRFPGNRVVNRACVSYYPDQILLSYRRSRTTLGRAPRVVIVAMIASFSRHESYAMSGGNPKPWCQYRDGELQWYGLPVPKLAGGLMARAEYCRSQDLDRLGSLGESLAYSWNLWAARESAFCRDLEGHLIRERGPRQADVDSITIRLLHQLHQEARADGSKVFFVIAPPDHLIQHQASKQKMQAFVNALAARGAEVLELRSVMGSRAADEYYTSGNNRHPNRAGHTGIAEALTEPIARLSVDDLVHQIADPATTGPRSEDPMSEDSRREGRREESRKSGAQRTETR